MYSIIMPMDTNRLEQFKETKRVYDSFEQEKEFLIPTRNLEKVQAYLEENNLMLNVRLLPYEHTHGFNPSKALNIGVRHASYDTVIITCPEVKPITEVLTQFDELEGVNVIAQVWDEDEHHKVVMSLVNKGFRGITPAMYFLAKFNKKDIEKVNGWDEAFMKGYAYEDNDFGDRWMRAGIPFEVHEEIEALHQYHPRTETITNGSSINANLYHENNEAAVIRCKDGLKKLKHATMKLT